MILDHSGLICGCEVELITEMTVNKLPVWRIVVLCELHENMIKEHEE